MKSRCLEHPESRLYTHDLVSDKQGTDFESVGNARHRVQPHTTPKQLEFAIFAKQLAKRLEQALGNGDIGKLYIAASPTLLGLLRNSLHPNVTKLIGGEVDKDMTHMKPDEIATTLPFLFYA